MSRACPVKRANQANRVAHLITSCKQDLNLIENDEGAEKISNMILGNTWETFCVKRTMKTLDTCYFHMFSVMILTPKESQETILGEKIILEIAGNFCTAWSYFEDNNSTKSGL